METQTLFESAARKAKDANIGREWNAPYGRQRIIKLIESPSGNLYEVETLVHGSVRRYSTTRIDEVVKQDQYRLTPEYQAECEQREEQSRLEEERRAKAELETSLATEKLTVFTKALNYPTLQAGQARKALSKQLRYQGEVMTLADLIVKLVDAGRKPCIDDVDKYHPMTRRAFNRASQIEQENHERKVREGGKVRHYTLQSEDGLSMEIGAFGYAYAWYLFSMKNTRSRILCPSCQEIDACSHAA